jgi:hypothetical protein
MEKYRRARQVTDDNRAHAHCMLDILDYKIRTLRICNMYRFYTATMVAPTRLYVFCYPCSQTILKSIFAIKVYLLFLQVHISVAFFKPYPLSLKLRYQDIIRYIKNNNPQSAYALHILKNKHEYGPMHNTMELSKRINKTKFLIPNCISITNKWHLSKIAVNTTQCIN